MTVVPLVQRPDQHARALKLGRYIARLTVSNAKGNAKPITISFAIVREPARWCIE